MILGYRVSRAIAEHDAVAVEAWFSPEVLMPAGPLLYGGLRGLILALGLDDGAHR